jgi:hypothetical protein
MKLSVSISRIRPLCKDFSFCSELNTKLSLLNERIIEVPIKYSGRTVYEGKKIRLKDAFIAIFTIIKFRFFIN